MTGVSLHEIKNKRGQLLAKPKMATDPIIVDIPSSSPVVDNLNADLLDNKHLSEIQSDLSQQISTEMVEFSKNVGHLDSINGVSGDPSKDLTIRAIGDIKIFPNPSHNELVLMGHNAVNGVAFVDFLEPFDSERRSFSINSQTGFIDGPDLMIFYDGILLKQGADYTFDRENASMEFLSNIAPPDPTDNIVAFITTNGARNQGLVLINYIEGTIDGFNKTFIFPSATLANDNLFVFKNGMMMKATDDYTISDGNKVIFTGTVALQSKLYFLHIRPYGGILTPVAITGVMDGVNYKYKISDNGYTSNTLFVWKNGTLMARDGSEYSYDPYQGSLILAEPPAPNSYLQVFYIAMESNVVSINSVLPDDFRNIELVAGDGISITPDYQKHSLKIEKSLTSPGGTPGASSWKSKPFVLGADPYAPLVLDETPIAGSEFVIYQRLTLHRGVDLDYTINGNTITLNQTLEAIQDELVVVRYQAE